MDQFCCFEESMRNWKSFFYTIIACIHLPVISFAQNPDNDLLCNSVELTVDATCNKSTNGNLKNATRESDEPSGSCLDEERGTLWYHFTAPPEGNIIVSTNHPWGRAKDVDITLYHAPSLDCAAPETLEVIACNKDENSSLTFLKASITASVTPGDTYYVQVQPGEKVNHAQSSLGFCITVESVEIPLNDDPARALYIPVEDTCKIFNNIMASVSGPEEQVIAPLPVSSGNNGGWIENEIQHSVWFKFAVPASGVVEINTYDVFAIFNGKVNTTFNTQLAIYQAENPADFSTFELMGANDDVFSTLAGIKLTCLTPGDTLYILVDGSTETISEGIAASGKFLIDIREVSVRNMDLTATTSSPVCEELNNGSILTRLTGGVGPFSYQWSNGANTPNLIRTLGTGTYTLTIRDQCDSVLTESFNISPPESLSVNAGIDTAVCEGDEAAISLKPVITGGTQLDIDRIYSIDYDVRRDSNIIVRFPFSQTSQVDTLYQVVPEDFRNFRMTLHQGRLIAVSLGSNAWFEIDPSKESIAILDTLPPLDNEFWQGIACHPETNQLYAISGGVDANGDPFGHLYEININEPDVSLNSSFQGIAPQWLAIDTMGNFYTSDFFSGSLFQLYPRSQNYEEIGEINIASNQIEDAAFDPSTNRLYMISNSSEGAELWQLNTNSAFAMKESQILGTNTLTGFAILKDTLSDKLTFNWESSGNITNPSQLNQVVFPDTTTQYILSVSDACGTTTSDTFTVEVKSGPEIALESYPDEGNKNGAIYATATGGTPPYTYLWNNGATEDSLTRLVSGIYTVQVIDALGCISRDTVEVPLNINTNLARMLEAGITSFLLFPNPAQQSIMVELSLQQTDALSIYLYDQQGKTLHREDYSKVHTISHNIPLDNLPSGMYIVQIQTSKGYTAERFAVD